MWRIGRESEDWRGIRQGSRRAQTKEREGGKVGMLVKEGCGGAYRWRRVGSLGWKAMLVGNGECVHSD